MVFCLVQNFFFRTTQELEYFLNFFFVAHSANFFLQNPLGYMTKILNQIFFLHQNQNIKLNGRSLKVS